MRLLEFVHKITGVWQTAGLFTTTEAGRLTYLARGRCRDNGKLLLSMPGRTHYDPL